MDNLSDIKKIWLNAPVKDLPTSAGILKIITQYRLKHIIKNVLLILIVSILVAVMCWVVFAYRSQLLSTRIGEAFFFIAMLILLRTNAGSLKRSASIKDQSNGEFIDFLKEEQRRLVRFQKTTQVIGFAFASIGLLLYLFEVARKDTQTLLLAYIPAILWIVLSWYIIRPIALKRKTKKLEQAIKKLETLSLQLSQ